MSAGRFAVSLKESAREIRVENVSRRNHRCRNDRFAA